MTTQPPDLKKLREVAASFPNEETVRAHIAKIDEMFGPLAYCSFEHVHSWAILKFQISQLLEANPSALLDAYEASARDAERYRWLLANEVRVETEEWVWEQGNDDHVLLSDRIDDARHATQGD